MIQLVIIKPTNTASSLLTSYTNALSTLLDKLSLGQIGFKWFDAFKVQNLTLQDLKFEEPQEQVVSENIIQEKVLPTSDNSRVLLDHYLEKAIEACLGR